VVAKVEQRRERKGEQAFVVRINWDYGRVKSIVLIF